MGRFLVGLIVFLPLLIWLPWWMAIVVGLGLGWWGRGSIHLCVASGLAHLMLAFFFDGQNFGRVSERLAGLFYLASPTLVYLLMGIIGFLHVYLGWKAGAALRTFAKPSTL